MKMLAGCLLSALACAPALAADPEPCGMRAARLLSEGQLDELGRLFEVQTPQLGERLAMLGRQGAHLTGLAVSDRPRFSQHRRITVRPGDAPPRHDFILQSVNASAPTLGPVQVQVEIKPHTACSILAIHLDHGA